MTLYLAIAGGRLACITEKYDEVAPYGQSNTYRVYEIEASPVSFDQPVEEPETEASEPEVEVEVENGE
jgi:hypothetical protein